MDFFQAQDKARRRTGHLVFLFALAVVATALAIGGIIAIATEQSLADPVILLIALAGTTLVVGGASLFKHLELKSGGGQYIAESLGGRPADPSRGASERQLLNIVSEMSIASGVPEPAVYVMDDEPGINAFAAGYTADGAVIGVTRGCMTRLSRDELQGVIAHEFSHILNGDMRMNIKLMAWIFGLLAISSLGRILMSSVRFSGSSRGKNDGRGAILLIGLMLFIIGMVSYFFGRLLQAAISRQREYLADASAVQFTRNPQGIAKALQRILENATGSRVVHPRAAEASHMFFGSGLSSFFATHPPLEDRIHRIDPSWDPSRKLPPVDDPDLETPRLRATGRATPPPMPAVAGFTDSVRNVRPDLERARAMRETLAPALETLASSPAAAQAAVGAIMLADNPDVGRRIIAQIAEARPTNWVGGMPGAWRQVAGLDIRQRLATLCLLAPALRPLRANPQQAKAFLDMLRSSALHDGEVSLYELAVINQVRAFVTPEPTRFATNAGALRTDIALLMIALASESGLGAGAARELAAQALSSQPGLGDAAALIRNPGSAIAGRNVAMALENLSKASPAIASGIIAAACQVIAHDGRTTDDEFALACALCGTLRCPMPILG